MHIQRRRRSSTSLNIAPLIDVVFLLLIFFMLTTSFNNKLELQIQLPKIAAKANNNVQSEAKLNIDAAGNYALGGASLNAGASSGEIANLLRPFANDPNQPIYILGDAKTQHESVVRAMQAASSLGFSDLRIVAISTEN